MALSSSPSSSFSSSSAAMFALAFFMLLLAGSSSAQLSENFYVKKCPKVFNAVKSVVQSAVAKEPRMGASLLRVFFHDCFVNGCDGSVLLDDTSSFKGEKTAPPNKNSLRGYEVIDAIKSKVEAACPGVVSCADIVAIAARDSVAILGGPYWKVKLGRRDSKTASFNDAGSGVIPPPFSTLSNLISRFQAQGLSTKDMVALSGAHTIGKARCATYKDRIYNDTNINSLFATSRKRNCPRKSGSERDNNVAYLDFKTPNHFDNYYYKNLINKKGLLHSDQVLFSGGSTDSIVAAYSNNQKAFESDFVRAMIKMGNIKPLTGSKGEIRKHCGRVN
ncbi:peroxidase 4-like [Gastrolobium bilobum]|uniref:peroxidase 4-like n=1 Tax=Gastrolobium bilobum TaxID=150636 RepID=UPI002AB263D7|nr:peroxidase 4-like [Gastrolobium bilobum]